MRALIVHCHPEPASLNGALTEVTGTTLRQQGHTVEVSDLYREDFDPRERPEHYGSRENSRVFFALGEQRHAFETNTLPEDVRREIARLGARGSGRVAVSDLVAQSPRHAEGMVRPGLCERRSLHQLDAIRSGSFSRQEGCMLRHDRRP